MNWNSITRKLKKAAPVVLSALSVVGIAATAVLSAKATIKALEEVEERDDAWKCYIPTALTAIVTAACIIGTGILNKKQQASLMSAYALLEASYRQYRNKAKELYGEDTNKKIINALAVENAKEDVHVHTPTLSGYITLEWGTDEDETQHIFYDTCGKRYFRSTISRVLQAEIALNRNLALGGWVSLNDFYEFIGIDKVDGGDEIGWCVCDSYYYMDFNHYRTTLDDKPYEGTECLVIDYEWYPVTEDELFL